MTWWRAYGRTLLHADRNCRAIRSTLAVTPYEAGQPVSSLVRRTCELCSDGGTVRRVAPVLAGERFEDGL
jgi:hypothetical protein